MFLWFSGLGSRWSRTHPIPPIFFFFVFLNFLLATNINNSHEDALRVAASVVGVAGAGSSESAADCRRDELTDPAGSATMPLPEPTRTSDGCDLIAFSPSLLPSPCSAASPALGRPDSPSTLRPPPLVSFRCRRDDGVASFPAWAVRPLVVVRDGDARDGDDDVASPCAPPAARPRFARLRKPSPVSGSPRVGDGGVAAAEKEIVQ